MRRLATTTMSDGQPAACLGVAECAADILTFSPVEGTGEAMVMGRPAAGAAELPRMVGSRAERPSRLARHARAVVRLFWVALCRLLPNQRGINRLVAGVYFRRVHGRRPALPNAPESTINDFIFHRMTGNRWSDLERRCVDKITAKEEAARLSASVGIPRTRGMIFMDDMPNASVLYDRLSRFAGEDLVAKPAHGSGATLWFAQGITRELAQWAFHAWRDDYFWQMRETQYAGLPRRIVIEDAVRKADGAPPDDYKFMCVRGTPVLLQVDHDRFGPNHLRRLYRLPHFDPYHADDGTPAAGGWQLAPPELLADMAALATALSRPFDYVRIDLLLADRPYFGEFTFSQGASLGRYVPTLVASNPPQPYGRYLLDRLRENAFGMASQTPSDVA